MNQQIIQVVVYDDNEFRRESLALLINGTEHIRCTGTFPDCSNVVRDIEHLQPHIVLMDIDMPGVDGIEGVRLIRLHFPHIQILMQTVFDDDEKIFASICAGASGYILKKSTPQQILQAIEDVHNGGAAMTASVARQVIRAFRENTFIENNERIDLSPREREILGCLVKGLSHKMIAAQCFISIHTVNSHIKKIYEKLHVNSVAEAVAKALRQRLV
ncbi:MAG: DNA-binding response regulator [Sphingobacteriales bacterium SCN 48-20]|jgi:DNA-binding NarL/FixJ family response regulator|uniref:response regulator transcription factor n=1 Tax=Terrimonas ferruginea TaxID=249 RepID=UPI00048DD5C4|nr:response regulator transcription factor [Terrimonas ferruginea]MBN8784025.1 response regulator transcription factor [Terrimonas ferruginea]ODT91342.1 MAG: DNA-binding response regulator [Sphingobacteriales bacterium SCN 48-20]OJW41670.1 MAG: DNA-binding response regulator [Sphingobacteriales bacterium 48-107]